MLLYWLLFLFPSFFSLIYYNRSLKNNVYFKLSWFFVLVFIFISIGLRNEVGADWEIYKNKFDSVNILSFRESIGFTDPAYGILNWISALIGGGVYFPNLICSLFFCLGLSSFCLTQTSHGSLYLFQFHTWQLLSLWVIRDKAQLLD